MKIKDELSELIRDRLAWVTTTISISPIVFSAFLSDFQGKPELFIISLYFFFVSFVVINSIYILIARKAKPEILVTNTKSLERIRDSKYEERTIARYPLVRPYARSSLMASILITIILGLVPQVNQTVRLVILGTPTLTPTQTTIATLTATSTFTATPSPTPTPKEHGIYYMIVLDASLKMLDSFETESKWDAALRAVNAILEAREDEANYGLVVIGGSGSQEGGNPCDQPSTVATPFSSRDIVIDHINQLQPSGGGSIFTAFNLAMDQFRTLPENTVRMLVFITGSSDACESRDEWRDLQRAFDFPGGIGIEHYSEIIVLEHDAVISRTIKEQFDSLSANLNVQAPQTTFQLVQANNIVINNVSNYVDITISSFPTEVNPTFTPISVSTPIVGVTNPPPPTFTAIPPTPIPPTSVPPTPIPPTPVPPTPIPQPTFTPTPYVLLTRFDYVGTGELCQALISFEVSGSPATGYFRVWNQWYTENNLPYDSGYPLVTLPVGPNGFQVGLGGNGNPAYYRHKVWFEYNGTESNKLDLICPGLTPVP